MYNVYLHYLRPFLPYHSIWEFLLFFHHIFCPMELLCHIVMKARPADLKFIVIKIKFLAFLTIFSELYIYIFYKDQFDFVPIMKPSYFLSSPAISIGLYDESPPEPSRSSIPLFWRNGGDWECRNFIKMDFVQIGHYTCSHFH